MTSNTHSVIVFGKDSMEQADDIARQKNEERENRILDAAAQLITHFGFTKTTIGDIANEAGISKGTLYQHWDSKEALFDALVWRETWRYTDETLRLIEADANGGTITGLFKNALLALQENGFLRALLAKDHQRIASQLLAQFEDFYPRRYEMLKGMLTQMQAVGAVREDVDIQTVAYLMNVYNYGFLKINEVMPKEQCPEFDTSVQVIADIFDHYLTPPDGGNSEAGKQIIHGFIAMAKQQVETMRNQKK